MTSENGRTKALDAVLKPATMNPEDLLEAICRRATAAGRPLTRVRIQTGDVTVEVEWAPQEGGRPPAATADQVQVDAAGPAEDGGEPGHEVLAPIVGTFYRAPEPGAMPFTEVGDTVAAGQQVGILEAMKLMNAITSDFDGVVTAILAADGESVEYGQVLVRIGAPDQPAPG